jgi:hypothetical protein
MKSQFLSGIAALLLIISGCEYFENGDTQNVSLIETTITGLPAIPDTMTFVGWFDSDEVKNNIKYVPEKVFVLDADGSGNIHYKSEKPLKSLIGAQKFYLTTERKALADSAKLIPSTRKIMLGYFSNAATNLQLGDTVANFEKAAGVFNLLTPTNGSNTDELSGLWFVDSVLVNLQSGLKLPALYEGWIYEGWVEINNQLVSTGRFSDPKKADLFKGYSSSSTGLNFPGEDFLVNAPGGLTFPINLSNAKVYISIEYNDGKTNGTSPFKILLLGTIPASAQSSVTYKLNKSGNAITSGNAIMVIDLVK